MPNSISIGLRVIALAALLLSTQAASSAEPSEPTPEGRRMQWWREAKFGMFIHWGVYAAPAGTHRGKQVPGIGEWIMKHAEIPVDDYRAYAGQFNPVKYNPTAWAKLAQQAGMRYVVITAKHHDGFALYDSAVTDWDVVDATPYGKDLLTPLADAVRHQGLRFGLYYSQAQDWTHPGGAKMGHKEGEGWDPKHQGDFDAYLSQIAVPQTREALTKFKPDVLWWDTPVWMTRDRAKPLHDTLSLRPGIITNNRLGGGYSGDTETPEQHIPATGFKDRDWETCMTMNDTWGYKSYDHKWKSTEVLLHNLVDIVSKGGNYLLNVGPTAEGEIPQPSIDRLRKIGDWMRVNGDAIYATTASPCRSPAWGRLTSKPGRLYLHVFDWPSDGKLVVPVEVQVTGCRMLADKTREFSADATDAGVVVHTNGAQPDEICSVIELEITGEPIEILRRVKPNEDGSLVLTAVDAHLAGRVQVSEIDGQKNLGYWTESSDLVQWHVAAAKPGKYSVMAEIASPDASSFAITAGGKRLVTSAPATGSYGDFVEQKLGLVNIASAGDVTVKIIPEPQAWRAINLRRLVLTPEE